THFRHPDGTPFPAEECAGLRVLREGAALTDHEDFFIRKDGSFVPVVYTSSRIVHDGRVAGLVVVFRDVTHQKEAAAEREALLAVAGRARADAERAADMVRGVQRISDAMLADLPLDDLLREVLARGGVVLSTEAAIIVVHNLEDEDEEDTFRVRATIGIEDEPEMGLRVPDGAGFHGLVAKGRRAIAQDDVDPALGSQPALRRKNARALAGVPFLSGDRLLAVPHAASVRPRRCR